VISHETGASIIKSQHHHAHIVSVCAENDVKSDERVVGIALDGAGYGSDGAIWGGEVLISIYSGYERVGHLQYLPMPGGDLCAYNPYRMLISGLTLTMDDDEIRDITENHILEALPNGLCERELILKQARLESVIKTSSSGRFLDSIASLLDLSYRRTYEGEPAMRLEACAEEGNPNKITVTPEIEYKNEKYVLKIDNTLKYLIINKNRYKKQDIAAFAQKYLSLGFAEIAVEIARKENINTLVLSGGVTVNEYISNNIIEYLEKSGLRVLTNRKSSLGDGGSALGQSCIALASVI